MDRAGAGRTLSVEHHGAFARRRAEDNGVPRSAIDRRLRSGELEVLHKGVFCRRGTPESYRLKVEAARLAVGDRAVAARRTAACLFGLLPPRDIEILTDLPRRSRAANYTLIRTKFLPDDHVVEMNGIPTTSVPRTLLDLGGVLPASAVQRLAKDAIVRRLTTGPKLLQVLRETCAQGRPGSAVARRLTIDLDDWDGRTESELEDEMFEVLDAAGHSDVGRQVPVHHDDGTFVGRPDGHLRELGIVLEAYGYEFHSARPDWQRDFARQNDLVAAGKVPLIFTWADARRPARFLRALEKTIKWRAELIERQEPFDGAFGGRGRGPGPGRGPLHAARGGRGSGATRSRASARRRPGALCG